MHNFEIIYEFLRSKFSRCLLQQDSVGLMLDSGEELFLVTQGTSRRWFMLEFQASRKYHDHSNQNIWLKITFDI